MARALAGVRARVPRGRVAERFRRYLDQVYAAARDGPIALDGQNVFVYYPRPDGDLAVDFCVGATLPFDAVGDVVPMQTPDGVAATTTHWGDYSGLGQAHEAVIAWCRMHDRTLAGPSWEVYGHWYDDATRVRTDVYYLLQGERAEALRESTP